MPMCYGVKGAYAKDHGHSKRSTSGMAGTICERGDQHPNAAPALLLSAANVCTDPRGIRHSGVVSRAAEPPLLTAKNIRDPREDGPGKKIRREGILCCQ